MITRLALYATLGLTLAALGQTFDTVGFWLIITLVWASEQLARREGIEDGIVIAIDLPQDKIDELKRQLNRIKTGK
jgi:hypothetical protein